jgi:DNA-binding response OmpR family regulator
MNLPLGGVPARDSAMILVVDDDDQFRSILLRALTNEGYKVAEASDGEAALTELAESADGLRPEPDVVLLDACLPGFSGLGILRAMRRFQHRPPTFMLTGFRDASIDALAQTLGAVRVFHKPIDLEEVLSAILSVLNAKHSAGGSANAAR